MSSITKANERRKARLRELFIHYDVDKSGYLSPDEASCLFASIGLEDFEPLTAPVNYEQFLELFAETRIRQVFNELDIDKSGSISKNELLQLFDRLGHQPPPQKELDVLFGQVDSDRDGVLSYAEFLEYFGLVPDLNLSRVAHVLVHAHHGLDFGSELSFSLPPADSPYRFIMAGASGGLSSRVAVAPLERVKIIMQTTTPAKDGTHKRLSYRSVLRDIIRSEGLPGLFRGTPASLVRVVPFTSVVCLCYASSMQNMPQMVKDTPSLEAAYRLLMGGCAGLIATCVTYPLDVIRARQAAAVVGSGQGSSITAIGTSIYREHGIAGLFRGFRPTATAVVPFIAVQQSSYDLVKKQLLKYHEPSVGLFLTCGVISGICAQTAIHPLDSLRRRAQVFAKNQPYSSYASLYGLRILAQGLTPALLKVAPAVAISLSVRDAVLGRLGS